MKASKLLQKQFADFKAEFAALCREHGGTENPRAFLAGDDSAFVIRCAWGNLMASVHFPWDYEGHVYPHDRHFSTAAIYLQFRDNTGEPPFSISGEFNPHSHKWNIQRSAAKPEQFVAVANDCLSEFWRRLQRATATPAAA